MRPLNYDSLRASERAAYDLLRGRAQYTHVQDMTRQLGRWDITSIRHAMARLMESGVVERAVMIRREGRRERADWGWRLARRTVRPVSVACGGEAGA